MFTVGYEKSATTNENLETKNGNYLKLLMIELKKCFVFFLNVIDQHSPFFNFIFMVNPRRNHLA